MTIDEAKIKIGELACYARTKGWDDEYTEAVNMIIKALEQQSTDAISRQAVLEVIRKCHCEEWVKVDIGAPIEALQSVTPQPCEDAISRSAAINAAIDGADKWDGGYNNEREKCIREEIAKLSPVTPQPKVGWWIMSDDGLYRPICNNCGAHPWKGYIPTVEEATEVFKYCPNCGCAMQEVEE